MAADPVTTWASVRDRLRDALVAQSFGLVFERARVVSIDGPRVIISVETDIARDWVNRRYLPVLRDAFFDVMNVDTDIRVVVQSPPIELPSSSETQTENGAAPAAPVTLRRSHGLLQPRFTFESYVAGEGNRFAYAAALAVAEMPAQKYNPLVIYGGVGLGKTHLLHAIGNYVSGNHPELTFSYVSVETFTNDFINSVRDGSMRTFKDRYRSIDILLIDDIQSLEGREQTQEEFFHTFNALHDAGKQIVITSDRPPGALATLEARLRSRFEMGLSVDIQPPDLETRIAILRNRVIADGHSLADPEVLQFIAARITENVRQLEGALNRLMARSSFTGRPADLALASEVLDGLYPTRNRAPGISEIQDEVCRHYGVTLEDIKGERRTRRVVTPRQVAMYLCRELTDSSLPQIGQSFGGRDHTTVMHAIQRVSRQLAHEGELYAAVQTLTLRLKGNRLPAPPSS
jgi:chromosomal replication initiator protein